MPIGAARAGLYNVKERTNGISFYLAGSDGSDIYQYSVSTPYDISTASLTNLFDVSAQDDGPRGVTVNPTGSKLYVFGGFTDTVYEYTLTTSYDVTTASLNTSFSLLSESDFIQSIIWNDDGSKFHAVDGSFVYEYTVSSNFTIDTASFSQSFDVSAQDDLTGGIAWDIDGSILYTIGERNDSVYAYTLTTPFDISTASFSQSFDVSAQTLDPQELSWSASGDRLYVLAEDSDTVYQYAVSTEFDISTASIDTSLDVGGQDTSVFGMTWDVLPQYT